MRAGDAEDSESKQIDKKEAAILAREVLSEMASDAETQMSGLSSDISSLWAAVNADVQVARHKIMEATDATGSMRAADLMSSGTRDLFLWRRV